MGRKHCGKRRNCSSRAISPFPTVFSKGLFPRSVKRRHCVGMELRYKQTQNISSAEQTANTVLYHIDREEGPLNLVKLKDQIDLKPFPKQALVFTCLQYDSFENTAGKGEIARNEQFLLFLQCFLLIWSTSCHFHQI